MADRFFGIPHMFELIMDKTNLNSRLSQKVLDWLLKMLSHLTIRRQQLRTAQNGAVNFKISRISSYCLSTFLNSKTVFTHFSL